MATLEARLAKVEARLDKQPAELSSPVPAPSTKKPDSSVSPAVSSEPSVYDVAPSPVGNLYEGNSSFIGQFQVASEEIKRSVAAETPEGQQTISESFSQLHSILHSEENKKPTSGQTRSMPEIVPLPASIVLTVLRAIKGRQFSYPHHPNAK